MSAGRPIHPAEEVFLPDSLWTRLLEHARAGLPDEVFGLLGQRDGRVTTVIPVVPLDSSSDRLRVRRADIAAAEGRLEALGLERAGTCHSHPSAGAVPSSGDLLAVEPGELLLLIGLAGGRAELRAWRRTEDGRSLREVGLRREDSRRRGPSR